MPLLVGSMPKGVISITYIGTILPGLYFPLANSIILFLTADVTQGSPRCVQTTFGRDGFQSTCLWDGY